MAESMLSAVFSLGIEHAGSPRGRISISIGMAIWPSNFTTETASLIQQADRALYQSKRRGRNTVSLSEEDSSMPASGQHGDIEEK